MAVDPIRTVVPVIVQTADGLPVLGTDWVTRAYLRFTGGSEGAGQILGEATLVQDYGEISPAMADAFYSIGVTPDVARLSIDDDLVGKTVRLLLADRTGPDFIGDVRHTAFWWGRIVREDRVPDGAAGAKIAGGQVAWMAVGLAGVLATIYLREGWVRGPGGISVIDPGYLPPFNQVQAGDRSASTMVVGVENVYVHEFSFGATGNVWTAGQILDLLLAGAARPRLWPDRAVSGWRWVVSDPSGCLSYVPEGIDLAGMPLLDAINLLISPRRGMTWYLSVALNVATINVSSTSYDAISVGVFTLPAALNLASLDCVNDPWIEGLVIGRDDSSVYDVIEVRGARPWVALTVAWSAAGGINNNWEHGWSDVQETVWNDDIDSSLVDAVWRRFEISHTWDGRNFDGLTGLRDTIEQTSGGEYGAGGYDGNRTWSGGSSSYLPPAFMLTTERMLPCSLGFSTLLIGPRQPPVVVFFDGGSTYEDLSQNYRVEIDDSPPAVTLDDGRKGDDIYSRVASSGRMLVSLGFRETHPLRVSWQREPSEWPSGIPRIKLIEVANAEQWLVLPGTVTGADPDTGALLQQSGLLTIRDDTFKLRSILALARSWFGVPDYTVRWTSRGILDATATYRPSTLLTSVVQADVGTGVYTVLNRRSWKLVVRDDVEMFDTDYVTERVLPDLESLL